MTSSTRRKQPRCGIKHSIWRGMRRGIALFLITLFSTLVFACQTASKPLTRKDFQDYEDAMSGYNEANEGFRYYVSDRVRLKLIPSEQYGTLHDKYGVIYVNPHRRIQAIRDNTAILDQQKSLKIDLNKKTPGRRLPPFYDSEAGSRRRPIHVGFEKHNGEELPITFVLERGKDRFYFQELPTIRDRQLINKFIEYNGEVYELLRPSGPFYLMEKPFPAGKEPFLEFQLIRENEKESRKMKGIE